MERKFSIEDIAVVKLDKKLYDDVDISREGFERNFTTAVENAVDFAKNYISNELPNSVTYLVLLNRSYDEGKLSDTEFLIYKNAETCNYILTTVSEVMDILWVDGKVPEWIDVSVDSIKNNSVFVKLICCGRFSDNKFDMYLPYKQDTSPFSVKGPRLPPWYKRGEKFDLHWDK